MKVLSQIIDARVQLTHILVQGLHRGSQLDCLLVSPLVEALGCIDFLLLRVSLLQDVVDVLLVLRIV